MTNTVEVTALVKQEKLSDVCQLCRESNSVLCWYFEHGRSSGLFHLQEFGQSCEINIFNIFVEQQNADQIYQELYAIMELSEHKNGLIYSMSLSAPSIKVL
ncbi:MAG: hypothetical protein CMF46_00915 [Legionellales bacterium]|nr:hypothetical protein [Legionellales bacterium]|tara:strand:+ start:106 stop:408 length:303 start_codon:yes stop_codon:yes gene_type:complete